MVDDDLVLKESVSHSRILLDEWLVPRVDQVVSKYQQVSARMHGTIPAFKSIIIRWVANHLQIVSNESNEQTNKQISKETNAYRC